MTSRRLAWPGLARGVLSSFAWTLWQTRTRVVVVVEKELKKVEAKGVKDAVALVVFPLGGRFPEMGLLDIYLPPEWGSRTCLLDDGRGGGNVVHRGKVT